MAEREGFEPPCRLPDKTLSRRPRYDHFGTSPVGEPSAGRRTCAVSVLGKGANRSLYPSRIRLRHLRLTLARPPLVAEKLLDEVTRLRVENASGDAEPVIELRDVQQSGRGDERPGLRFGGTVHDVSHARMH